GWSGLSEARMPRLRMRCTERCKTSATPDPPVIAHTMIWIVTWQPAKWCLPGVHSNLSQRNNNFEARRKNPLDCGGSPPRPIGPLQAREHGGSCSQQGWVKSARSQEPAIEREAAALLSAVRGF